MIQHSHKDFIVVAKPEGITTHRSSPEDWGYAEHIENSIQQRLWVVHRLDRETSGLLILAKSTKAAQNFFALFESHNLKKKYLFLTDRQVPFQKKSFSSSEAQTEFKWLETRGNFSLWEAQPLTGKTHQIRQHALALGIPILGDSLYEGTPWVRLALHAYEIDFSWEAEDFKIQSLPPWWAFFAKNLSPVDKSKQNSLFENALPEKLNPSHQAFSQLMILAGALATALEKRQILFSPPWLTSECFRMAHDESSRFRSDVFGSHLWIYWYDEAQPSSEEILLFREAFPEKKIWLRFMDNRGEKSQGGNLLDLQKGENVWTASELEVQFEFRSDTGLSPGLFLDQRSNRRWVSENSNGKSVLNLFSYTCGFSVCAALGGATKVCSVDVSRRFLDWGKKNFSLNQIRPEAHEFFAQDIFLFLKGAEKRQRQFDLILIDPPSFGRSPEGVFRLEKDWRPLLDSCLKVLAPGGRLLFSNNWEGWTGPEFQDVVQDWARTQGRKTAPTPAAGLDFEMSPRKQTLKSLFIF